MRDVFELDAQVVPHCAPILCAESGKLSADSLSLAARPVLLEPRPWARVLRIRPSRLMRALPHVLVGVISAVLEAPPAEFARATATIEGSAINEVNVRLAAVLPGTFQSQVLIDDAILDRKKSALVLIELCEPPELCFDRLLQPSVVFYCKLLLDQLAATGKIVGKCLVWKMASKLGVGVYTRAALPWRLGAKYAALALIPHAQLSNSGKLNMLK